MLAPFPLMRGTELRTRRRMFEGRWATMPNNVPVTNYDVHPDGRSFVFVRLPADEAATGADCRRVRPGLALETLLAMKREAGRPQDLADVSALEAMKKLSETSND